jgi:hypothetical protein
MSKVRKITAFAAPAVMALAIAAPSEAKILLMGDGGWEVSFDGSVNTFYSNQTKKEIETGAGSNYSTHTGVDSDGEDTSRVVVGLLPAIWGMNVKAPTTGGIDMAARVMMGISAQNNRKKNTANAASGGQNGGNLDLREIHFTASGGYGQVLVGRTLSIYQGSNIVNDMTLFGVGAQSGAGAGGGTTLGRIGFGYVYPNFNTGIRYTTPTGGGFKLAVGVFDPSTVGGGQSATETLLPRVESEVSFANSFGGLTVNAWVNGMYQMAQRSTSEIQTACGDISNGGGGVVTAGSGKPCGVPGDVHIGGGAAGLAFGYGGLKLTATGYYGKGIGTTLMIDTDALDKKGNARQHEGGYIQGTYSFPNGTNMGASWGESRAAESLTDFQQRSTVAVAIESQNLIDVMVWHNINDNLRFVAEYGHQEVNWHDGAKQEADIVSFGGFFFW